MRRAGAASFGDVTGEYLALRTAAAYMTDWHDLVWVRGPDAVSFLDGLVSQAVAPLPTGAVASSLLLGPQGKLRAPHVILRGADEVGLVTDHGLADVAAGDLRRFKIRVEVTIEREGAPVVAVWGPGASAAVEAVTGITPGAGWQRRDGVMAAAMPVVAGLPRFAVVGQMPAAFAEAGIVRAGSAAVDAVRIETGQPIMGVDIDEGTIPQEAGLVDGAVDFTKGCYLGQELVARIDSRGRVNRHLRGIVLATNLLPPAGAEIAVDDAVMGTVTSVAESLELRAPVALGLVRREVEPGSDVTLRWESGMAPATVRALPLVPAGS